MTGAISTVRTGRTVKPARSIGRVIWHVVCIALLIVMLYPVVWVIGSSFKAPDEILSNIGVWPEHFFPDNYRIALEGIGQTSFWGFLRNSLVVAIGCVIGNVVACSLAAYAFARLRFRFRGISFAFMIGTLMLPVHVLLIPQYIIFQQLGLVGTYLPLILPKVLATDAFFVFLIVQFIRGLPRELDEAALIDGCGPFRIFWHIILPLIRPALITTAIFTFIWTWNDFLMQLIYINDPDLYTLPLALRLFLDQTSTTAFGPMMATSVLALVPVVLFFLAFQRYIVQGVATTGLKG